MRQYKVGDTVTIRSWESMEREFGSCNDVPGMFTDRMRRTCGTVAKITDVIDDDGYRIEDGRNYIYTPQMFTDWETDNKKGVDKMKLQYEGQEVERITEGYWPEGVELIQSNGGTVWNAPSRKVVCLKNGVAFYEDGRRGMRFEYFAIKPTKPAPRRLTNREVAELAAEKRFSVLDGEWVYRYMNYKAEYENDPTPKGIKLRAPDSDEWLEPTTDLMEVGK